MVLYKLFVYFAQQIHFTMILFATTMKAMIKKHLSENKISPDSRYSIEHVTFGDAGLCTMFLYSDKSCHLREFKPKKGLSNRTKVKNI
jgi:hypothetical protein